MLRHHHIPLMIPLLVFAVAGADIGNANAQSGRLWKSAERKFAPELRGLAEWLRPRWVRLEESLKEETAILQKTLGEATATERAPSQRGAAALVGAQQSAAVERRMKNISSWLDDARSQIVADLQEGADVSENDVATIFIRNLRAAAETSASPPIEVDPFALKVRFAYSVDILGIRIKPREIDLMPVVKKAGAAYLGCKAAIEKNAPARPSAPESAVHAGMSGLIMICVDSTLDLLKDEIRAALKPEPDAGMVARAAERGD